MQDNKTDLNKGQVAVAESPQDTASPLEAIGNANEEPRLDATNSR